MNKALMILYVVFVATTLHPDTIQFANSWNTVVLKEVVVMKSNYLIEI